MELALTFSSYKSSTGQVPYLPSFTKEKAGIQRRYTAILWLSQDLNPRSFPPEPAIDLVLNNIHIYLYVYLDIIDGCAHVCECACIQVLA